MTVIRSAAALGTTLILYLGAHAHAAPPASGSGPEVDLPLDSELSTASLDGVPDNGDMQREYPPLAHMMEMPGSATMSCSVLANGRLATCRVVRETPAGLGFGAATLRTAPLFHVHASAAGARITIPTRWQVGDVSSAPPPVAPPDPPASPASLTLARRILRASDITTKVEAQWRGYFDQFAGRLGDAGDVQQGQAFSDALRQAVADVASEDAEHAAHILASRMDVAQLAATADFLESSAGRAFLQVGMGTEKDASDNTLARIAVAARTHLCGSPTCDVTAEPAKAATGGR